MLTHTHTAPQLESTGLDGDERNSKRVVKRSAGYVSTFGHRRQVAGGERSYPAGRGNKYHTTTNVQQALRQLNPLALETLRNALDTRVGSHWLQADTANKAGAETTQLCSLLQCGSNESSRGYSELETQRRAERAWPTADNCAGEKAGTPSTPASREAITSVMPTS